MTTETVRGILIIVCLTAATLITRFLPFIIFPAEKETPKYIEYLGNTLSYATIGLLVVYCLKDVVFTESPFGLAEIISILGIVLLHNWKGKTLLSIGVGTILYMFLVQMVFI